MRSYLLREEFLSIARSAVAIREEYQETGVAIEAERIGSNETSFLLITPELANPGEVLVTLSFAQLEALDGMSDQAFHDALRDWLETQVREKCDCSRCRARRGEPARTEEPRFFNFSNLPRLFGDLGLGEDP